MIFHSDFYGKKLVRVLLQPLVNCDYRPSHSLKVLLALNSEYVSVNGLVVINSRVGNPSLVRLGKVVRYTSRCRECRPRAGLVQLAASLCRWHISCSAQRLADPRRMRQAALHNRTRFRFNIVGNPLDRHIRAVQQ